MMDLLDGFDKFVRPVENQTKSVDVYVFFLFVALQDFDEVQEKFSVTGVFILSWIDEHLIWAEDVIQNYGNITTVFMGYKDVWVPKLILTNPSQKLDSFGKEWQLIRYVSNGRSEWFPVDLIKATCSIDVWLASIYRTLTCSFGRDTESDADSVKRKSGKEIHVSKAETGDKFKKRNTVYEILRLKKLISIPMFADSTQM